MSQISGVATIVADVLRGEGGLQSNLDALTESEHAPRIELTDKQYITQNLPADMAERSSAGRYPCIHVYCEKVVNELREKSRTFSGELGMAIEVRVSSDRVERLETQLHVLVDAVTGTLEQNRGDLGMGIFFGGGYEIAFAGVKHGGKNFLQTAKITFPLLLSR